MRYGFLIVLMFLFSIYSAMADEDSTYTGSIYGRAISQMTQKAVPGINVRVQGTKIGAVTNSDGKFTIKNIPLGIVNVQFSGVGFETYTATNVVVSRGKPTNLDVQLADKIVQLKGIEVRSSYFTKKIESVSSTQTLSDEDIRRAPGVQEDVIRAVGLLPGVGVTNPGRNDLIVRGGAPFENLFIVDNIEVPNINHFGSQGSTGGPLSIINLDFVKDVTFSSGGFGAKYGDKTSSITNISLRNGNEEQFGGKINLSATGFGLNLEGPISDKGSYLFSVRRSYLDFIFKAAGFSFIPEYWDFQGKINYKINPVNSISFIGIGALGTVSLNNDKPDNRYQNSQIAIPSQKQYFSGITWRSIFKHGFVTTTLGRTYTHFNTFQNDSNLIEIFKNDSYGSENILKIDFDLQLTSTIGLTFGNQAKFLSKLKYNINMPGFLRLDDNGKPNPLLIDTSFNAYKNSSYFSLIAGMSSFKFILGGRLDYYNYLSTKAVFSPRTSIVYQINEISGITLSAGSYYQSPSMIWLIGAPNQDLKPIRADQIVLGYDHTPLEDVKVQVEGYYKFYSDYPARVWRPQAVLAPAGFEDASADILYGLEPLKSAGKGFARGIEIFIQKKYSEIPLYGLLSVSLSETKFTSLDKIERYSLYDSRFILNFAIGYRPSRDWEVASKFRVATGHPTTDYLPNGRYDYANYNAGARLPVYHQLDLRIDKMWYLKGSMFTTYIDIQNIYGRRNVTNIIWNARLMKPENQTSLGVFPTIGISFEF